jgi:tripartite-type tricarboxylate transporter receptor subunit TctC
LEKDFTPIALVAVVPQVVVVNPKNVPAANVKELLEFLRKNPAKLNYGSAGTGTSHHLAGELFKLQTKTFITHIPYTGAGPSLRDLVGGQVDMMFDGLGSSAAHIKGGRIKALMVSGDKRNPAFPDVPSAKEAGLPDYTVTTWYGIWAPKGVSADIQARAVAEFKKAVDSPELKAIWATQGAESSPFTQAQFGSFINSEIKRWQVVVKASGAKLD